MLTGEAKEHKDYVFGLQTTRGIIRGSDYFGIRSVRSRRYKYIKNLTPEVTFQNACSTEQPFLSWKAKAENENDKDAAEKVRRYQHRPAEELYDVENDPYEWHNLADDPKYAGIKAEHQKQLAAWMKRQGDKGQETELEALEHQARNRNRAANNRK